MIPPPTMYILEVYTCGKICQASFFSFFSLSVVKIGYPGAQVARLLGVSTSAVVRAAHSAELPEVGNYL